MTFAPVVQGFELAAGLVMMTAPIMLAVIKSPALLTLQVGFGIALLSVRLVFHLLTLPVELDASYRRLCPSWKRAASSTLTTCVAPAPYLRAAALTYVASSLVSLVNIARFRRFLRF